MPRRYEIGTALEEETPTPTGAARSLRTQQRAYDPGYSPRPGSSQPRRAAVLRAGGKPAAELVSVPPSSTTQASRAPPVDGRCVIVLAWLWTGQREAAGRSAP